MKRLVATLLCVSCAVTRPLTASNADLADHRAISLSRDQGERLARELAYLDRHPRGAWADDVRAAFDTEETAYYRACQKSRAAAVDYLAWLPHGPHARAATELVLSFDEHESDDEQTRMLRAARENEARFERAAEERADAENVALEALRIATRPAIFGRLLEDDGELSRYLLGGMSMGATPSQRTRTRRFTMPSRGASVERTLEVTLHVVRGEGNRVAAVEVSGPGLFARMAEASMLREVTAAEAERYVHDVVGTMVRASGANLAVEWEPDLVRIRSRTRQAADGGL